MYVYEFNTVGYEFEWAILKRHWSYFIRNLRAFRTIMSKRKVKMDNNHH